MIKLANNKYKYLKISPNNNNNSLLNIQFRSLLGLVDYSLHIYREKTLLRKPCNPSLCLLGLAYLVPAKRLQVTCGSPINIKGL